MTLTRDDLESVSSRGWILSEKPPYSNLQSGVMTVVRPSVCVCSDTSVGVLPNAVQENLYIIVLE